MSTTKTRGRMILGLDGMVALNYQATTQVCLWMSGDIDGAKWAQALGGYSLTLLSDNADTSATAGGAVTQTIGGRTYRPKIVFSGTGNISAQTLNIAGAASFGNLDVDGTLSANSDTRIPTQKAVKTYADGLIAANDAMVFKGVIDCSTNPNYPAADRGHTYRVSVAGKIGGASGVNVELGDILLCLTDGTASGNQATVGANWGIIQVNIDGAVTGPASATSGNITTFSGTSGKVIQDSGKALSTDGTFGSNSDNKVPTEKATKTYVDAAVAGGGGGGTAAMVFNCAGRAGGFDVWQRGAGGSAIIPVAASTTMYTCDGWYIATGTNQSHAVIATAGLTSSSIRSAYVQRTPGQTGTGTVRFAMPFTASEVAMFAGNYVALSFTVKAGANWSPSSGTLTANLYCGTGASAAKRGASAYTGESNPVTIACNLTTTAQRFQGTSAAVVSASATQAEIQFTWTPVGTAGSDDSFSIDDLQLEVVASFATAASDYAKRSFQESLWLCLPHYQKSYDYGVAPGAALGAGSNGFVFSASASPNMLTYVPFSSPMRGGATLTLTIYDGAGTAGKNSYYNGSWNNGGTPGTTQVKEKQFWSNLGGSGTVGFYGCDFAVDGGI